MTHTPAKTVCLSLLAAACGLVGCAGAPQQVDTRAPVARPTQDSIRQPEQAPTHIRAARVAARQVGVPYRYGGSSRTGFDCSGLVHYAYAATGVAVPRTTAALWSELEPVSSARLRTGDILFFNIEGKIAHVGMYLEDGRFVHAPSSGKTVAAASLREPYYRAAFVRGGRVGR